MHHKSHNNHSRRKVIKHQHSNQVIQQNKLVNDQIQNETSHIKSLKRSRFHKKHHKKQHHLDHNKQHHLDHKKQHHLDHKKVRFNKQNDKNDAQVNDKNKTQNEQKAIDKQKNLASNKIDINKSIPLKNETNLLNESVLNKTKIKEAVLLNQTDSNSTVLNYTSKNMSLHHLHRLNQQRDDDYNQDYDYDYDQYYDYYYDYDLNPDENGNKEDQDEQNGLEKQQTFFNSVKNESAKYDSDNEEVQDNFSQVNTTDNKQHNDENYNDDDYDDYYDYYDYDDFPEGDEDEQYYDYDDEYDEFPEDEVNVEKEDTQNIDENIDDNKLQLGHEQDEIQHFDKESVLQNNKNIISKDEQEMSQDQQEMSQDEQDMSQDEQEMSQNEKDMSQDEQDLSQDEQDLSQDEQDMSQDEQDMSQDEQDMSQDEKEEQSIKQNLFAQDDKELTQDKEISQNDDDEVLSSNEEDEQFSSNEKDNNNDLSDQYDYDYDYDYDEDYDDYDDEDEKQKQSSEKNKKPLNDEEKLMEMAKQNYEKRNFGTTEDDKIKEVHHTPQGPGGEIMEKTELKHRQDHDQTESQGSDSYTYTDKHLNFNDKNLESPEIHSADGQLIKTFNSNSKENQYDNISQSHKQTYYDPSTGLNAQNIQTQSQSKFDSKYESPVIVGKATNYQQIQVKSNQAYYDPSQNTVSSLSQTPKETPQIVRSSTQINTLTSSIQTPTLVSSSSPTLVSSSSPIIVSGSTTIKTMEQPTIVKSSNAYYDPSTGLQSGISAISVQNSPIVSNTPLQDNGSDFYAYSDAVLGNGVQASALTHSLIQSNLETPVIVKSLVQDTSTLIHQFTNESPVLVSHAAAIHPISEMTLNSNPNNIVQTNADTFSDSYAYSDAVLGGGIEISNVSTPTITKISQLSSLETPQIIHHTDVTTTPMIQHTQIIHPAVQYEDPIVEIHHPVVEIHHPVEETHHVVDTFQTEALQVLGQDQNIMYDDPLDVIAQQASSLLKNRIQIDSSLKQLKKALNENDLQIIDEIISQYEDIANRYRDLLEQKKLSVQKDISNKYFIHVEQKLADIKQDKDNMEKTVHFLDAVQQAKQAAQQQIEQTRSKVVKDIENMHDENNQNNDQQHNKHDHNEKNDHDENNDHDETNNDNNTSNEQKFDELHDHLDHLHNTLQDHIIDINDKLNQHKNDIENKSIEHMTIFGEALNQIGENTLQNHLDEIFDQNNEFQEYNNAVTKSKVNGVEQHNENPSINQVVEDHQTSQFKKDVIDDLTQQVRNHISEEVHSDPILDTIAKFKDTFFSKRRQMRMQKKHKKSLDKDDLLNLVLQTDAADQEVKKDKLQMRKINKKSRNILLNKLSFMRFKQTHRPEIIRAQIKRKRFLR